MLTLTYVSDSRVPGDLGEMLRIRNEAAHRNAKTGLTGCLYCDSGFFLQILEGSAVVLLQTMRRITRDRRHRNIQVIDARETNTRRFERWHMKLVNASTDPGFARRFDRAGLVHCDRHYLAARVQELATI